MTLSYAAIPGPLNRLGEGPCWDDRRGRYMWVDILGGRAHWYNPSDGSAGSMAGPDWLSSLVPCRDGRFIAFAYHSYYMLDPETERFEFLGKVEGLEPDVRFNDCKCDGQGRIWAGTMAMDGQTPAGRLYRFDRELRPTAVLEKVTIANGLDWSPDGETMYFIDTVTRHIRAYEFREDTGELSGERTVVRIPEGEGGPDGMTVDAEGMIWAAQWGGSRVCRWNPRTGERLLTVPLPAERTSSCAFGGIGLRTLLVTSAQGGEAGDGGALAGAAFLVETPFAGRPPFCFAAGE